MTWWIDLSNVQKWLGILKLLPISFQSWNKIRSNCKQRGNARQSSKAFQTIKSPRILTQLQNFGGITVNWSHLILEFGGVMATDDEVLFVSVLGISKRREARGRSLFAWFSFSSSTDIYWDLMCSAHLSAAKINSELSEEERRSRVVINPNERNRQFPLHLKTSC